MAKAQRIVALKILPRRSPQRRGERGANAERAGEMSPSLPLRDLCDLRASAVKEAQVFRERTFGHLHRSSHIRSVPLPRASGCAADSPVGRLLTRGIVPVSQCYLA